MSDIVWGLDPGTTRSALVCLKDGEPMDHWMLPNEALLARFADPTYFDEDAVLVIEQIAAMGMAVGAEVFETCYWSGRFAQAWSDGPVHRLKRVPIKVHLCGSAKAKDANVRQALLDRFGPIGTKKAPGPLYGFKGDEWAALAVAVTWYDLEGSK